MLEQLAAVLLSVLRHLGSVPMSETKRVLMERFLAGLVERNPDEPVGANPYAVRGRELFQERSSLRASHLGLPWFALAYWSHGLLATKSGLSKAEFEDPDDALATVRLALLELGIDASAEQCTEQLDRFIPLEISEPNVTAATSLFLSFVRFLHQSALRRRQLVGLDLGLPGLHLVFAQGDADQARDIAAFLRAHGVGVPGEPTSVEPSDRVLVLLSPAAVSSEPFWRILEAWRARNITPMVLCLGSRADLYRAPPPEAPPEIWAWLSRTAAIELSSKPDRYLQLLRALDDVDPKQWWWRYENSVELGLAVDILRLGIPRPAPRRARDSAPRAAYPYQVSGDLLAACLIASRRGERDSVYTAMCDDLTLLRQRPNGEPYSLPWFAVIYRAWLFFARELPDYADSSTPLERVEGELRLALFALGIGTRAGDVPAFFTLLRDLPWASALSSVAAVDERTAAFIYLVHELSQAALARGQRMSLRFPRRSCFVSYARADETLARELVDHLEAKGADVWWDINALTLGTGLDATLGARAGGASLLFLLATEAAAMSSYVQLEVQAALREGLDVVCLCSEGRLPPGVAQWLAPAGARASSIDVSDDRASAFSAALSRLERDARAQLDWLESRAPYRNLLGHLRAARADAELAARV